MNWFLIALIAPALWSVCNHMDKYLISRYFKGGGTGALVLFSMLVGFFVFPLILIFHPDVLNISLIKALIIVLSSVLTVSGLLLYIYALKKDEASIVVALFQLIPVFGFILGYIFLGETLTLIQILGSVLIIGGGIAISLELEQKKDQVKIYSFFLDVTLLFFVCHKWCDF